MTGLETKGDWPLVDLVVVEDFRHSLAPTQTARPDRVGMLRVHMDIRIKEPDDLNTLRKMIADGKPGQEIFDKVVAAAGKNPNTRGDATLRAALGLLK